MHTEAVHSRARTRRKSTDQRHMRRAGLPSHLSRPDCADDALCRCGACPSRGVSKSVQISYAIGVAKPLSVMVFTFGTSLLHEREILKIVEDNFDLRPGRIIK